MYESRNDKKNQSIARIWLYSFEALEKNLAQQFDV